MAITITDPSYISEHALDKVVKEKFHDNADDPAVRDLAIKFVQMFRPSTIRDQTLVDILHGSQRSRHDSREGIAEIGFVMGMQYGFELALSFPLTMRRNTLFRTHTTRISTKNCTGFCTDCLHPALTGGYWPL